MHRSARRVVAVVLAAAAVALPFIAAPDATAQSFASGEQGWPFDLELTTEAAKPVPDVAYNQDDRSVFTVTNVGGAPAFAEVQVTLPVGATLDTDLSDVRCAVSTAGTATDPEVVTCAGEWLDGANALLGTEAGSTEYVVFSYAPDQTGAALETRAVLTDLQVVTDLGVEQEPVSSTLEYDANNEAVAYTNVTGGGAGWIKCGDQMESGTNPADGSFGVIFNGNPKGTCNGPLPVIEFRVTNATSQQQLAGCGGAECQGGGFKLNLVDELNPATRNDPFEAIYDRVVTGTCKGGGWGAGCPEGQWFHFVDESDANGVHVDNCLVFDGSVNDGDGDAANDDWCVYSRNKYSNGDRVVSVILKAGNGIDLSPLKKIQT